MEDETVDLRTEDSELDSLLLEEYPGRIYGGQHNITGHRRGGEYGVQEGRAYWFYDLEKGVIEEFLNERFYDFEYEGDTLEVLG